VTLAFGTDGRRGAGISVRASEPAFEVSERVDNFRGFEGAVSPADGDLDQDLSGYQLNQDGLGSIDQLDQPC
jgi:hypothetical protein